MRTVHARVRGFALVIVLAFVVLLTGIVVALFSRAACNRQLSDSSANQIRSELLIQGVVAQILGDLKQEIAAGSIITGTTVSGTTYNTFYPATAWSAVPCRTGAVAPPNVVKWSAAGAKFFDDTLAVNGTSAYPNAATYPPSQRAAQPTISSTSSSLNGRFVSLARWNKPLLLPKNDPASTDATPATTGTLACTTPAWVIMGRDGSNPATSGSNVVGRYAYTIYDEGGVLDMNVAGYRASDDNGTPADFSTAELGRKGVLAAADLTRIGLTGTQTQTLVNWRNAATLQAGGANYLSTVLSDTTGFLRVSGSNGQSDRAFPSRQSLMSFVLNNFTGTMANRQNLLQYMGIFSRDNNAPSYRPDPNRPRVLGANATDARTAVKTYEGNMAAKINNDLFNPAFLEVKVKTAFTRFDGTQAVPGEPLVKSRFPLRRLAWLTYKGPSADSMDAVTIPYLESLGFSEEYLRRGTSGTDGNVYKCFGLTWVPNKNRWTYDHGVPQHIMRLDEVAAAGREPDFFELLQAAIHVGSLGKTYFMPDTRLSYGPTRDDERYFGDNSKKVDMPWVWPEQQIIEIGACIIDQFDVDRFPTEIAFLTRFDSPYMNYASVYGQENLPTLHRIVGFILRRDIKQANLPQGAGNFGIYFLPDVWNVNDQAYVSPFNDPKLTPDRLRFGMEFPLSPESIGLIMYSGTTCQFTALPSSSFEWSPADFDAREPVLAYKLPNLIVTTGTLADLAGIPLLRVNSQVSGSNLIITNVDSTQTPQETQTSGTSMYPGGLSMDGVISNGSQLKYHDPDGNWRIYNQHLHGQFATLNHIPIQPDYRTITSIDKLDLRAIVQGGPDPRSRRFAISRSENLDQGVAKLTATNLLGQSRSMRWDKSFGVLSHISAGNSKTGPTWTITGSTNSYLYASCGLLGINQDTSAFTSGTTMFYADADGVVRGADGQYEVADAGRWEGQMLALNSNVTGGRNFSRPIVLDRPFRSVGELGYAFRGCPWKSVDFFSANSGDAALLDVFCLQEPSSSGRAAGVVNLNTRNGPVLDALLSGGIKDETLLSGSSGTMPVALTSTQLSKIRDALSTLTGTAPLRNRAELVTKFVGDVNAYPLKPTSSSADDDAAIVKRRREAPVRALSDCATTSTWNLMIDVIAQSGRYPPNALNAPEKFVVEAEKRYWVHVAIDRLKNQVIDMNWEVVSE